MQVKIIGITKQKQSGIGKKSNKAYSGFFVTFGYERDTVLGYEAKSMLYTDEMIERNKGYIPVPGDTCEVSCSFSGFVEMLTPVIPETGKK